MTKSFPVIFKGLEVSGHERDKDMMIQKTSKDPIEVGLSRDTIDMVVFDGENNDLIL